MRILLKEHRPARVSNVTDHQAVALSLEPGLSRLELTERLKHDPSLLELANSRLGLVPDVLSRAAEAGIGVLPWHAPEFPQLLLAIPDCPPVLWYRGRLATLCGPAVAVVGSRAATAGGLEVAKAMAAELAGYSVTTVSGLARGVDSAAHRGALTRGTTIAVLGSGLDRIYPAEHGILADEIARTGLVLSEYPPGTPPLAFHFPQRNRLISGLSMGVVVIEAAEGSGSLITASCALEQGRDVMVIPGNVLSGRNKGGHALIRDGATIVECATDVVAQLGLAVSAAPTRAGVQGAAGTNAPPDPVLSVMNEGEVYDLDGLTQALGIHEARLLAHLLELELQGCIRRIGGGRFIRPGRTC